MAAVARARPHRGVKDDEVIAHYVRAGETSTGVIPIDQLVEGRGVAAPRPCILWTPGRVSAWQAIRPCSVTAVPPRLSPGDVIGRAFGIYRDQIGVLLPAALAVFAVDALVTWVFDEGLLPLVAVLVSLVLATLYEGMVVQLVRDVQDGRRDNTVGELFGSVSPVLLPLIAVSLLAGLGIGIGFLLLIVPGLILLTIWSVAAPVTVIERPGVFSAFGRSRELVRGYGWPVFGTVVLVFLLVVAASIAADLIGLALGDVGRAILSWIFNALTQPVAALTASVLYFTLLQLHGAGETRPA